MFGFLFNLMEKAVSTDRKAKRKYSARIQVRRYEPADRRAVLDIAEESFDGVSLDQNIEQVFGRVGKKWQIKKREAVDYDLRENPEGAFIAEFDGKMAGFICTRMYGRRNLGHIVNVAVAPGFQGVGVGRALMDRAFRYLERSGAEYLRIETLQQNEKAQKFYSSLGFTEIGRQIFYFKELE